jgi:hypothetical protein
MINTTDTYSGDKKEVALRVARMALRLREIIEGSALPAARKQGAERALQTLVLALRDAAR